MSRARPTSSFRLCVVLTLAALAGCGGGGAVGEDLASPVEDLAAAPRDFAQPVVTPPDLFGICQGNADCPPMRTCCSGACVDVSADPGSCGACGVACGDGGVCCASSCSTPATDPSNCGACGNACRFANASAACSGGACALGACHPRWADCNHDPADGCEINTRIDIANCGACGTACDYAHGVAACSDACYLAACDFGWDDCDGVADNGCETTVLADVHNCGACGNACGARPNATVDCENGGCLLTACKGTFLDCNGDPADGCEVNGGVDSKNCGSCGNACPMGLVCRNGGCTCPMCNFPNATSLCVNNKCALGKCLPGWGDCDGNAQNGCEADLTADNANCGACGNACPGGNSCIASLCSLVLLSDTSWKQTLKPPNNWQDPAFNDAGWSAAFDEGLYGTAPWGKMPTFDAINTQAHWIWYYDSRNAGDTDTVSFRRAFTATVPAVTLTITADDHYTVWLNNVQVAQSNDVWSVVHVWKLNLTVGKSYLLAVSAQNTGGPGGLLLDMR